jgi:hypothetical protein
LKQLPTTASTTTQRTTITTKKPSPTTPKQPKPTTPLTKIPVPTKPSSGPKLRETSHCCADAGATIEIPLQLKSAKSESCSNHARLIIPAEFVGAENLKKLLSDPTDLAKTILNLLS